MMIPTSSSSSLEDACTIVLNNNYDSDTKQCFVTLIKMIDNIIQKPLYDKYRTINLSNPTFHTKIGIRKGGIEYLQACGFIYNNNTNNTNSTKDSNDSSFLVLPTECVDMNRLIAARRLLETKCIQELNCKPDELPQYQPPPAPIVLVGSNSNSNSNSGNSTQQQQQQQPSSSFVFNPYVGSRYDGLSAATGINFSPGPDYTSPTEIELQKLQSKQQQLEMKLQQKQQKQQTQKRQTNVREWIAHCPINNNSINNINSNSSNTRNEEDGGNNNNNNTNTNTNNTNTNNSDAALLAYHLKQQQQENMKKQNGTGGGGFTTKAMRDLERLRKQKVYSHTVLTIVFPDGYKLISSSFVPKDTIYTVIESIQKDCFVLLLSTNGTTSNGNGNNNNNNNNNSTLDFDFDLYVTPPRRLLIRTKTLQEEDLVPAAKIFVSWKKTPVQPQEQQQPNDNNNNIGPWYLKKELFPSFHSDISTSSDGRPVDFQSAVSTVLTPAYPIGYSIIGSTDDSTTMMDDDNDNDNKMDPNNNNNNKKLSREDALLQRMMGGGGGLTTKNVTKKTKNTTTTTDTGGMNHNHIVDMDEDKKPPARTTGTSSGSGNGNGGGNSTGTSSTKNKPKWFR